MKQKYSDGIHDISNEQYHSSDAISRSQLMLIEKSPLHFWHQVYSGNAEKKEPTPAMNVGSAFHTLLLEPELFDKEFIIMPKIDRRTTQGKLDYEEFSQKAIGKILLTDEQFEQAFEMANQAKKHDIVNVLLGDSLFEQSIFWTDPETGIQFKARPDIWSSKMIVDLKTTADATLHAFQRSAFNYGYYLQAGMIHEACKAIDMPFEMFATLAIEKEKPYVPAVFILDDAALQFGIDQFSKYKKMLSECLLKNEWPGYIVQELSVPAYAIKQLENEE